MLESISAVPELHCLQALILRGAWSGVAVTLGLLLPDGMVLFCLYGV